MDAPPEGVGTRRHWTCRRTANTARETVKGRRDRGARVHAFLTLSSHGVDLRAVTAASGGALYCEDGRHSEGLTLHYGRCGAEAYPPGYRAGPAACVRGSSSSFLTWHNVAACKRANLTARHRVLETRACRQHTLVA